MTVSAEINRRIIPLRAPILYAVCILGTFFFGLGLGRNKVVYASFRRPDMRYPYICQVFVGLPALPALVQRQRVMGGADQQRRGAAPNEPLWNGWMAPPHQPVVEQEPDELAYWHRQLKGKFELGTLYTMVAGLLNVLVIYDAYAGPVFLTKEQKGDKPPPKEGATDSQEGGRD